jgi:hypothetical protein
VLAQAPCDKKLKRTVKYPDLGYRRNEILETLYWKTQLPVLDGNGWHKMKSLNCTHGTLYRAEVLWLRLVHNSWTHLVRAEFDYALQRYDDDENVWRQW